MDNNNASFFLANALNSMKKFVDMVENGEGLNIPAEQKEKFKEEMKKQNFDKLKGDFDKAMEDIINKSKSMNNGTN